jgi:hypothetical protein
MAADEEQPQDVVAVVGGVDPSTSAASASERSLSAASGGSGRSRASRRTRSIPALRPTMTSQAAASRGGRCAARS